MKENWKEIKGYEGIYEVSDLGRIRTMEGKTTHSVRHGTRVWKQRIMKCKGYTPKTGFRVSLWKDKKSKDFLVARLVAFNFLNEDINNRELTVNHIDGNRMNNHISNLELVSIGDNIRHAFETGLIKTEKETKLKCLKTGKIKTFRSMSKASLYLGYNVGYISSKIKKNKLVINDKYEILL